MLAIELHYLPFLVSLWFLSTFITTYLISTLRGDVVYFLPYISDTGTYPPTSCIFGQMMNLGACFLAIVLFVRYLQVKQILLEHDLSSRLNLVSLYLGLLSAVGISIVGNFQETNVISVHLIGANLAFGLGACYQVLMWYISTDLYRLNWSTKAMNYFRLVLAFVSTATYLICIIVSAVAVEIYSGDDITKWTKHDDGFYLHIISSCAEWICAFSTIVYIFTFYDDFRYVRVDGPTVKLSTR